MAEIAPRLLTERQLADYLNVPAAEVRRLDVGRIALGRRIRFDRKAVDDYLDEMLGRAPKIAPPEPDEPEAALARFREAKRNAARNA